MLPIVYTLLANDSDVASYVSNRIYRHGSAPQTVAAPYITWFVVTGTPENELGDVPGIDRYTVQVDCWSNNTGTGDADVEALALAVRTAIEPTAHMTSFAINEKDYETQRYRIGMVFDFWTPR